MMKDSTKLLALSGVKAAQVEWLNAEVEEFLDERTHSPNSIMEYLDVLGIAYMFNLAVPSRIFVNKWIPRRSELTLMYRFWSHKQASRGRQPLHLHDLLEHHFTDEAAWPNPSEYDAGITSGYNFEDN